MNEIALQKAALTMTSREIAKLVDARHDNVKIGIERLVDRRVIVKPATQDVQFTDSAGRPRSELVYVVAKRDSYVVVAQLSPEFTARVVDRWQALEALVLKQASERLEASQKELSIAYAGRKQLQLQLDRLELEKASRQALVEDSKLVKVTSVRLQLAASQKMVKAQADSMQKLSAYKDEIIADLHKKLDAAKSKNGMRYV